MAVSSAGGTVAANWSVNGVAGGNSTFGTIDSTGLYKAPANFPSPNGFQVTAIAQANSSQTASGNITVVYPSDNAKSQPPPIELGTSGGNSTDRVVNGATVTCCSGTLGSLIQRGASFFILSNNHVLDKSDTGTAGDPIGQPGLVDNRCNPGTVVANLTQGAALKPITDTNSGACAGAGVFHPCGPAPSKVDAAIAQIVAGAVDPLGKILDLGAPGSSSIAAAPPSSTLAVPATVLANNTMVAKSGRTSGLTCSTLMSVMTTTLVVYNSSCGGAAAFTATFSNQVIVNGGSFSASGDSGSLIVTADNAQPVALLYGGNSTSSSGNPIQDVITAFTLPGPVVPAIVGGADHAVSCDPTSSNPTASPAPGAQNVATLAPEEIARATRARELYAGQFQQDPAVSEVGVGVSADGPREGAVLIRVTGALHAAIPALVDGVRTRVIYEGVPAPRASVADITRAAAIKDKNVAELFARSGVQGVGVGVSDDNSAEAALVIYIDIAQPRTEIPAVIDGLRTKIIEGDRFRTFDWGKEPRKPQTCSPQTAQKK